MANWANPTVLSNYITFVDEVKARDVDAITLQLNAVTTPPTGAVKLVRAPVKFQEWDGSQFVDRILSTAGGGTGATSLSGLGSAMGLGTMAYQNSNSVSISGGSITASLTSSSIGFSGGSMTGISITNTSSYGSFYHLGNAQFVNPAGATLPIYGVTGAYALSVLGAASGSFGLVIRAGTNINDHCLNCLNQASSIQGPYVSGDMVLRVPYRLTIPVGANMWA